MIPREIDIVMVVVDLFPFVSDSYIYLCRGKNTWHMIFEPLGHLPLCCYVVVCRSKNALGRHMYLVH